MLIKVPAWKLPALVADCRAHHVMYGYGLKASPLSLQAGQFHAIDCSGFSRWAVYHATAALSQPFAMVDGSVAQHDWARSNLAPQLNSQGSAMDDRLRIAFLSPEDGGIGHVMLIQNGFTCESHGSVGPDRREWLSEPFMRLCSVYVLGELV